MLRSPLLVKLSKKRRYFFVCIALPLFLLGVDGFSCAPGREAVWGKGCLKCPINTFQPNKGHHKCRRCPLKAHSRENRKECICPRKPGYGSHDIERNKCICKAGTYSKHGGTCIRCKRGFVSGQGAAICTDLYQ